MSATARAWRLVSLPTADSLPVDVWASRHRLIRGVVWSYALLLPIYGGILNWKPWVVLLSGLLPAMCAVAAGLPHRRLAAMAATCGLLLPSVFFAHFEKTPDYAVQFHCLASMMLAWLYRDSLIFPIALAFILIGFGIHPEAIRALAETGIVLIVAATSLIGWAQYEAKGLRATIAQPDGVRALAKEFRKASQELGLEDHQANVVLSLAILRVLKKTS
jgi:hypothetical protein